MIILNTLNSGFTIGVKKIQNLLQNSTFLCKKLFLVLYARIYTYNFHSWTKSNWKIEETFYKAIETTRHHHTCKIDREKKWGSYSLNDRFIRSNNVVIKVTRRKNIKTSITKEVLELWKGPNIYNNNASN